jgi:hypothetical protein
MRRLMKVFAFAVMILASGLAACVGGTGTTYVGVYGPPVYGPAYGGAWGRYPYAGRYPPRGGGVWVGVCCEQQEQEQQEEEPLTWEPDLREGEEGPPVPTDLPRTR